MKKVFKKYLDILYRGKSDRKRVFFDVVASCSIFDKYIFFEEYFLMSCYKNKQIGLAIEFVIYEFEVSKKWQVSLVVQYRYIGESAWPVTPGNVSLAHFRQTTAPCGVCLRFLKDDD